MIRVLLADDQAMIRGALSALLSLEDDITVVCEVGRGTDVVPSIHRCQEEGIPIDVAILDIEMPGGTGIEATTAIRSEFPSVKCLILTTFGRPGYLQRALSAGALGFMVKETPARELAKAIRRLHEGERVIDSNLATAALIEGSNPLSERERELLTLTLSGDPIAEIARRVFLSEGTVRNHLSSAMAKTHTATRMQAALLAQDNGWL
ncbi:response regulator transcription factor [Arcanobacterium ihumii]|uniref:response regulator transcription factor n=1 Tax=Arcanobacterium ihumii TaxID=2138162 RepID=UPI000F529DAB|nr:response regulator transcription factor [Arcanobacterium ihumii]